VGLIALQIFCSAMDLEVRISAATPDQQPPGPVEPPHKPAQQGTKIALTVGIDFLLHGQYEYTTRVMMPDGSAYNYSGKQGASGGTLLLGAAITPRAALRRMTFGFNLETGGLESWAHSVIPSGTTTPFSQSSLDSQLRRDLAGRSPWSAVVAPYIEHEVGFFLENRVRLGYQYWRQTGSASGSFRVQDNLRSPLAGYDIRFANSAHLIRVSFNNYTSLDDTDAGSGSTKRKTGFLRQAGLQVGTNKTVTVFLAVGPLWSF
jgi:hypothetical protein